MTTFIKFIAIYFAVLVLAKLLYLGLGSYPKKPVSRFTDAMSAAEYAAICAAAIYFLTQ